MSTVNTPTHKYVATLLNHGCAVLGCGVDREGHSLADDIGIDVVRCPACDELFPVTQTVRFMHGRIHDRRCRSCAGFVDQETLLSVMQRFEAGRITQDDYDEKLAEFL